MMKKIFAVAAVALLAACGGADEAAEGDAAVDSTVMTIEGTDSVPGTVAVPVTDSVVTTTTTDTIEGHAADSIAH